MSTTNDPYAFVYPEDRSAITGEADAPNPAVGQVTYAGQARNAPHNVVLWRSNPKQWQEEFGSALPTQPSKA